MESFFYLRLVLVALCLIVSVSALTDEQKEKLRSHSKICIEETGADRDLVGKVRGGDFSLENDKLKEFTFCVLKRSAVINDDGVLQKDVAIAKVEESIRPQVGKAIDACVGKTGNNRFETAWNYMKCYHEERPSHDFF